MYYDEVKEMMEQLHPGANIQVSLDSKCVKQLIFDRNGDSNAFLPWVSVMYDRAKVVVDNKDPIYVKMQPHRVPEFFANMQKYIGMQKNVMFLDDDIRNLKKVMESRDPNVTELKRLLCEKYMCEEAVLNAKVQEIL